MFMFGGDNNLFGLANTAEEKPFFETWFQKLGVDHRSSIDAREEGKRRNTQETDRDKFDPGRRSSLPTPTSSWNVREAFTEAFSPIHRNIPPVYEVTIHSAR